MSESKEKKGAEEALGGSNEHYRDLYETMAIGVVYQDASGSIMSANPAAEVILGLSVDQMQGRTSIDPRWRTMHEDGADFPGETHPAVVALQTGEKVSDVVMGVFNPRDEQTHWINVNAVPQFKAGEKQPYQVYTTFDDITERKRVDEALRESEERFRDISDNMADWIWEIDADGKCTYASGKVEEIMGYKTEELLGKTPFDFMPEDEAVRVSEIFKKIVPNQEPIVDLENWNITKNGGTICILTSGSPVLNKNGVLVGYRGVNKNITERKRAEAKLKEYSENLEQMVAERSQELKNAHEKLLSSEKMAAIGQFSAGIAHDLRNPLGVISNAAYLLKLVNKDGDEKVNRYIELLEDETKKTTNIISSLMDFARTEPPKLVPVKLHTIIDSCLAGLQVPDNIDIVLEDGNQMVELPDVLGDANQIGRVYNNIINNALQAMPDGGKLTISATEDGKYVSTEFTDTGKGIAKGNIEKVFEPLFTTKQTAGGTGIGLAASKSIIDAHKGIIKVKSTVGEGTAFTVQIPLSGGE